MTELSPSLDEAVDIAENPQRVPVNMYETTDSLVIVAPVPGVMEDDIDVQVADGQLRLQAAMRTPGAKQYLLHEWHYGPYERTVDLPEGFGPGWESSFGNGQLVVRIKRA